MSDIKKIPFNSFQENCFIVWDDAKEDAKECAIIDPGFYSVRERDELYNFIAEKELKPSAIILTHGHFDHIFGVSECAAHFGIPVYMHPADKVILENNGWFCRNFGLDEPKPFETVDVEEGAQVRVGSIVFEAIHTPGHTPGGMCWLCRAEKMLFSGDTLFAGTIGRTDNQWGDYESLIGSILAKLMELDGDIEIFPGHAGNSSIAEERTTNPFLQPFNEPYEE